MSADPPPDPGRTLDPSDWPVLKTQAHRMLDDILDYIENIRERPVWQPIPDPVRASVLRRSSGIAFDLAEVHDEFMRYILPLLLFATGNVHPGFMGWGSREAVRL